MYNVDIPNRAELPSSKQLLRSTVIAILAAIAILVAIVLPAEYAIDPTGIGRALGLAEMGEIKLQLAEEAERDRIRDRQGEAPPASPSGDRRSSLLGGILAQLAVRPAAAQTQPAKRIDETAVTLKPGEGTEIKLVMKKGAKANFTWSVEGGAVNFDLHGDGGGEAISYEKGRSVPKAEGVLIAAFDGDHGWFYRNRGRANVTVVLRTEGDYAEIKHVK